MNGINVTSVKRSALGGAWVEGRADMFEFEARMAASGGELGFPLADGQGGRVTALRVWDEDGDAYRFDCGNAQHRRRVFDDSLAIEIIATLEGMA